MKLKHSWNSSIQLEWTICEDMLCDLRQDLEYTLYILDCITPSSFLFSVFQKTDLCTIYFVASWTECTLTRCNVYDMIHWAGSKCIRHFLGIRKYSLYSTYNHISVYAGGTDRKFFFFHLKNSMFGPSFIINAFRCFVTPTLYFTGLEIFS